MVFSSWSCFSVSFIVLASTGAIGNLKTHNISNCSAFKLTKFSALPFCKSISFSLAPFDLVHSDVWGPSPVLIKGSSYKNSTFGCQKVVFIVIWEENILLMIFLICLLPMEQFTKPLIQILSNKMVLPKGNIGILLKLLILFCVSQCS